MATTPHTRDGDTRGRRRAVRTVAALAIAAVGLVLATGSTDTLELAASAGPTDTAVDPHEHEEEGYDPRSSLQRPKTIEAAFARESYRPGDTATLRLFSPTRRARLRILHVGPQPGDTRSNARIDGVPVGQTIHVGSRAAGSRLRVRIGDWPSGLYTVRLDGARGWSGFAPFVVRPRRLGTHRVAVVMPTQTWQAYNVRDDDGDGRGDSWYAGWWTSEARLARPFLDRGVPKSFRYYDLHFLQWLARQGHQVDVLADVDLHRAPSARRLAKAYALIVFPGHHEYVTERQYELVTRYRDLGGNLMFLSANNFFWKIVRRGNVMTRVALWRDLGRPEAALIGVQYRANNGGGRRGAWVVRDMSRAPWLFDGTGLGTGSRFSSGGIEIDAKTPSSPRGTRVLAEIPHVFGRGLTAQMTYYETPRGARVFAAGAFTFAGSALQRGVSALLERLWARLTTGDEDRPVVPAAPPTPEQAPTEPGNE